MDFDLRDGGENGEHDGTGPVEICKIFVTQVDFFDVWHHLTVHVYAFTLSREEGTSVKVVLEARLALIRPAVNQCRQRKDLALA